MPKERADAFDAAARRNAKEADIRAATSLVREVHPDRCEKLSFIIPFVRQT
jgi:hypothetical protein